MKRATNGRRPKTPRQHAAELRTIADLAARMGLDDDARRARAAAAAFRVPGRRPKARP